MTCYKIAERIGYSRPQIIRGSEIVANVLLLNALLEISKLGLSGLALDPFVEPGLILFIEQEAVDWSTKFPGVDLFPFGNGNIFSLRNESIT